MGLRGSGPSEVWGCFPHVREGAGRKRCVLPLLGGGPVQSRGPELLQLFRSPTGEEALTEKEGTRARALPGLRTQVFLSRICSKACSGCPLSSAHLRLEGLKASLKQWKCQ